MKAGGKSAPADAAPGGPSPSFRCALAGARECPGKRPPFHRPLTGRKIVMGDGFPVAALRLPPADFRCPFGTLGTFQFFEQTAPRFARARRGLRPAGFDLPRDLRLV
jgi:hypothetical protein